LNEIGDFLDLRVELILPSSYRSLLFVICYLFTAVWSTCYSL